MLQPTTPSIFPGLVPSQEPADSRGSSEGQQPLPARAAPLTLEAELLFGFSLFPPGTATGMVFPTVGRGQLLVTGIPQGCGEALQGAGPGVGVVKTSHAQLSALLGQRMQKARVWYWHRFPFMALQ